MSDRPDIPMAIQVALRFESGNLCAVCGTSHPLEFAHIVPWCDTWAHRQEDMICLCSNCHTRADSGKLDQRVLRAFKAKPWVLRQREFVERATVPTTRFVVTIQMEKQDYDERDQMMLRCALAGFLKIQPDQVRIRLAENERNTDGEDID